MPAESVNFCTQCGMPLRQEMAYGKVRPVCEHCGWVFFPDPKVAAAVLIEESNGILLIQRGNDPYKGLWTMPAGFIDAGEDPAVAAVRECLEETGLEIEIDRLLDVVYGKEHPRGADFVIFYQGHIVGGTEKAGDDATAAGWFPRNNLPELAFNSTRKILQAPPPA